MKKIMIKEDWEALVGVAVSIVVVIFFGWTLYERKVFRKEITENPTYAIGKIERIAKVRMPRAASTRTTISASYSTSRGLITETEVVTIGERKDAKEGELYLIVFHKEDPRRFYILLDYPIKDSTDFKRYMKEIDQNPLNFDYKLIE